MKVRFLIDRTVKAVDGPTFRAGEVYDLPEGSARRWIARAVAVEVKEEIEAAVLISPEVAARPKATRRLRLAE